MTTSSQRWRERRHTFRPGDDEPFTAAAYEVGRAAGDDVGQAKSFVVRHHYSATCPNSDRFRFLLWRNDGTTSGVAVFGTPSGPSVLSSAFPFLAAPCVEAVELQRLVLLDEVPANGESWFVSRCLQSMKRDDGVEAVVSFSDPQPRQASDGTVVMPGHVGVVYQALGAWYTGTSKQRWTWRLSGGQTLNERDLTKVAAACPCCGSKRSTSGAGGAVKRLLAAGAEAPGGACYREWLCAQLQRIATRAHHPGNHRYLWGLSKAAKAGLAQLHGSVDSKLYPKKGA